MIIEFANKKVEKICNDANYAKKQLPLKVCKSLQILMVRLFAYENFDCFYKFDVLKKYRAHELQGDKKGIISLSIDYSYRMEVKVKVEKIGNQDVITILEVSNHYGD
ncbi:MAG: hypothetical protein ACLRTQ_01960 [Candidatus Borkfalkia sp.]|nr:MAG TPA: endoribonuclease [Caudoviricetes sp.]